MKTTIQQLRQLKSDLEDLKEYQCGDHPTRILCVSNVQEKEVGTIENLLTELDVKSVHSSDVRKYNFILIFFYDLRQAKAAHKILRERTKEHDGEKWVVSYALAKDVLNDRDQNQGTLVVFNMDYTVTNEELREIFGVYGDIKEIRETPNKKHHKFIEFYDLRDAQEAWEQLNQREVKGRKLKIEPSRPGGIRQRLLKKCVDVLGLGDNGKIELMAMPNPVEMTKLICRAMKEVEYSQHKGSDATRTFKKNYASYKYSQNQFASAISLNHLNNQYGTNNHNVQHLLNLSSDSQEGVVYLNGTNAGHASFTGNKRHGTSQQASRSPFQQKPTQSSQPKSRESPMKAQQHPSPRTRATKGPVIKEPSQPMQTSFEGQDHLETKKMPTTDISSMPLTVPRPTIRGQELSKQYEQQTVGTPHLVAKKFNMFSQIELKGIGLSEKEDLDEMKTVLVVENIPVTFTYHELTEKIERSISCFYDQLFMIAMNDMYYKCIVRVTNQMVVESFKMAFHNIFLENDQEVLCSVHETTCQGNDFSHSLSSLLL